MISYPVFKVAHLAGVLMLFMALGAMMYHSMTGGQKRNEWRRPIILTHGLGMLLIFVAGFGMIGQLGIFWPWPLWVWGMFLIWLFFGGIIAVIYKRPKQNAYLWWIIVILGVLAVYFGVAKPV